MIPIFQTKFGYGEGNCAHACIASIFELPLKLVDFEVADWDEIQAWTALNFPELTVGEIDLAFNVEEKSNGRWAYEVPNTWEPPTGAYWMASVNSRNLQRPESDPYYPMPALHAIVMKGRQIAHDPNPNNPYMIGGSPERVVMQTFWTKKTPRSRDRT